MAQENANSAQQHVSIDLIVPPKLRAALKHANASTASLPGLEEGPKAIALVWKSLKVTSTKNGRVLLDNVTGRICSGLYAVMGPSGSGKTTLLNTLACRLDRNVKATGELRLNGRGYTLSQLKQCAGYVMQDDVINGTLTVQETLMYTAELRLPPSLTHEQREERVTTVLTQMGLLHTRDTLVGTPLKKGISGGERKRLCVAQELLTRPLLLFLDEPTSGLDSVNALSLMSTMRRLADSRECTVVSTIHQPQAKIFNLFGHLLLLQKGKIVYQGPAQEALEHFADNGFPCPMHENPADHFLDIITPNMHDSVDDLVAREKKLNESYSSKARPVDVNEGMDLPVLLPRETTPWTGQFTTLFRRSVKEQWRRKGQLVAQVVQSVIMAVLIGTVFLQIGDTQSSVVRRQPVLFFCVINQGIFGALTLVNSFPAERILSLRERAAGMYYCSAYFLAKSTADLIFQLPLPVLFSVTVYWLVGFQNEVSKYFIFMGFMVLCSVAATSLAIMVSAFARTTSMALTILPMAFELARLYGGFFLSPANLPKYFSWLDALSFVKYTYVGISLNELTGLDLTCTPAQVSRGTCITQGETTIDTLGLDRYTMGMCAGILVAYIFITRLFAFIGIRFIKW